MGGNTARLREIVGWVERQRNPTNADKCWVSFLNPTYVIACFYAKPTQYWDGWDVASNPDIVNKYYHLELVNFGNV
ncbi:hypothetical protein F7734_28270 [Scytonema sp. UIC 10036]|uniref:hypothetical protein n=1 Tax=Scytonema sp. UIC 10036 TaxID=2304196 RepID=UPI0012DAAB10|nr:hypothetical protein [Scytonema sp. UIC 10036]MUG96032.1 hypothetical protein [Scytonema sp. UIC 10036]